MLLACLPAVSLAAELGGEARRGKVIYFEGTSPSGAEIVALVGPERTETPASILPCGNCHGADGRGQPDADLPQGVAPADLRWDTLTAPTGTDPPNGRWRPAYDEPLLRRAITRGVDAAGNRLHAAMPRYRLILRDSEDLIAYIRRLGSDPDPPPAAYAPAADGERNGSELREPPAQPAQQRNLAERAATISPPT